ncbi:hypothetical protein B0T26DRAFT_175499 [Lasiosphaeria miniovina]|uniref:Uncharacterized protein n=1 Tax=Lasiosphaeria miniovina TaxID=1954250 RepID=A0AA40B6B7_9PEZI|nr:uncharacterized protein B0T26DRAFT_175499 [Lasiosphaeria miniovina]KAK0728520.1 hypothetical protein B0T26DRAFT_175499 [Lasiosphaeria miniovina]
MSRYPVHCMTGVVPNYFTHSLLVSISISLSLARSLACFGLVSRFFFIPSLGWPCLPGLVLFGRWPRNPYCSHIFPCLARLFELLTSPFVLFTSLSA